MAKYADEFFFNKMEHSENVGRISNDLLQEIEILADGGYAVIFPQIVNGVLNGEEKTLKPHENWGGIAYGNKQGVQKDENGRYKVAVGPRVLIPDYPDDGKLWDSDFTDAPKNIDVVVRNVNTKEIEIIRCVKDDNNIKAHSYNNYPDNHPEKTMKEDNAAFNIQSGWVQTGITYPNSSNAQQSLVIFPDHMNGNIVEFAGRKLDFRLADYEFITLIVYKK